MKRGRWVSSATPSNRKLREPDKAAIAAACRKFIDEILKPRFLPRIRPTQFNYPIDIRGAWHGPNYRFIQRYRSGFADNLGEEFDAPFTRLEFVVPDVFDVSYLRHTGKWHRLYRAVSLSEALSLIESDGHLHPL
jgi:hypothetical protein